MSRGTVGGQRLPAPAALRGKRDNIIRTLPVKAGESVAAGDVVDVVGGQVQKTFAPLPNEKTEIYVSWVSGTAVCKMTDTTGVVFTWTTGAAAIGYRPYEIVNGKLQFTYKFQNDLGTNEVPAKVSCARLSDTKLVVAYIMGSYNRIRAKVVTFSDNLFTFGAEQRIDNAGDCTNLRLLPLEDGKCLLAWDLNGNKLAACVLGLSGTTDLTVYTQTQKNAVTPKYISACRLPDSGSSKRVCVCYLDAADANKCKAVVATISSSNVVTWGTPVTFEAARVQAIGCNAIGNTIYVAYPHLADYSLRVSKLTATGAAISVESYATTGNIGIAGNELPVCVVDGKLIVCCSPSGEPAQPRAYRLNTQSMTFGEPFVFNAGATLYADASVVSDRQFLVTFADGSTDSRGAATLLEVSGDQIAGGFEAAGREAIALQSGSGGQSVQVIYDGVAELAGVTAGTSITSPGVQGYAPMDGLLWVGPAWETLSGEYIGTGLSGEANKCRLELGFMPKVLLIQSESGTHNGIFVLGTPKGAVLTGSSNYVNDISWSETAVTWYTDSGTGASAQLNTAGSKYRYCAWR